METHNILTAISNLDRKHPPIDADLKDILRDMTEAIETLNQEIQQLKKRKP